MRREISTGNPITRAALVIVIALSVSMTAVAQQFKTPTAVADVNKKEADAALTEALKKYRCKEAKLADSIYQSIFQSYTQSEGLKLSITHRRYGALPPPVVMTMQTFICFFKDDFNLYCSVSELEGEAVSLTVMLQHNSTRYAHMLVAQTTKAELANPAKPLNADFYSYIPQHSIAR